MPSICLIRLCSTPIPLLYTQSPPCTSSILHEISKWSNPNHPHRASSKSRPTKTSYMKLFVKPRGSKPAPKPQPVPNTKEKKKKYVPLAERMKARDELRCSNINIQHEWLMKLRLTSRKAPGFYNETQLARKAVEPVPETQEDFQKRRIRDILKRYRAHLRGEKVSGKDFRLHVKEMEENLRLRAKYNLPPTVGEMMLILGLGWGRGKRCGWLVTELMMVTA